MRLWHKDMIKFLPDMQLKGQWRECALIAHQLKEHGTPNHLLVNRLTEFPIVDFLNYCHIVSHEMKRRNIRMLPQSRSRIEMLGTYQHKENIFNSWHDKNYLRICYANLAEKHFYGVGKSRITNEEWQRLCEGYKNIIGEDYKI